ncbi:hypothetical protein E3N88_02235 [Mikania micrantha]|uniref:CCHC-type domain-containing protein n=1 Tax=Mikania micrantha TaxID=192012 RepID=A0A5N6Q3F5_9ASTR|nr:hypothetical protein E3N88_02235 [Mikania micrantha]
MVQTPNLPKMTLFQGAMSDLITPIKDPKENNMLHLVGKIAKKKRLEDVYGVALRMQLELLWFHVHMLSSISNLNLLDQILLFSCIRQIGKETIDDENNSDCELVSENEIRKVVNLPLRNSPPTPYDRLPLSPPAAAFQSPSTAAAPPCGVAVASVRASATSLGHHPAFIAFIRDANWDKYVDSYFTVEKFKAAYDLEIAPMLAKDQWVHIDTGEKIYPPTIKRPSGRPRKNIIKSHDEPRKRHKCSRCYEYGHHEKTCKNSTPQV